MDPSGWHVNKVNILGQIKIAKISKTHLSHFITIDYYTSESKNGMKINKWISNNMENNLNNKTFHRIFLRINRAMIYKIK